MVQHVAASFTLITTGLNNSDRFPVAGYSISAFGVLVMSYFLYRKRKGGNSAVAKSGILFLEAAALVLAAFLSHKTGKTYLPYVILAAALGYFIAFGIQLYRARKEKSMVT